MLAQVVDQERYNLEMPRRGRVSHASGDGVAENIKRPFFVRSTDDSMRLGDSARVTRAQQHVSQCCAG